MSNYENELIILTGACIAIICDLSISMMIVCVVNKLDEYDRNANIFCSSKYFLIKVTTILIFLVVGLYCMYDLQMLKNYLVYFFGCSFGITFSLIFTVIFIKSGTTAAANKYQSINS